MVSRMADGERPATELEQARRVATPAAEVVDFGTAPLELAGEPSSATLLTEFIEDEGGPTAPSAKATLITDFIDPKAARPVPRPSFFQMAVRLYRFVAWLVRSLFGIVSLILLLAVIAAIPVVNLLALGYLLEVEGRVARSGKLRDAFPLIHLAPRLGSIVVGIWAWVFPLRLLSTAAADARIIDPGSRADIGLHLLVQVLAIVVTAHLCLALARGGSLWSFFRPLVIVPYVIVTSPVTIPILLFSKVTDGGRPGWLPTPIRNELAGWRRIATAEYWTQASTAVHDFIAALQLKHHFLLGLKGYVGAMLWLVIPTALFAAANKTEGGPILVTLFGGLLLILVLSWVPFLQAHYAAENRFRAMFELRRVCAIYKNAPFAWTITMLVTLTLALPMYLFKIALPPSDAMWMVTIVFIVSIYPVKVLTGWAYHRALAGEHRQGFFLTRWASRLLVLPVLGIDLDAKSLDVLLTRLVLFPLLTMYVFLLFFTQFIGEHGKRVLFEHHAFLLPAPF